MKTAIYFFYGANTGNTHKDSECLLRVHSYLQSLYCAWEHLTKNLVWLTNVITLYCTLACLRRWARVLYTLRSLTTPEHGNLGFTEHGSRNSCGLTDRWWLKAELRALKKKKKKPHTTLNSYYICEFFLAFKRYDGLNCQEVSFVIQKMQPVFWQVGGVRTVIAS